jgi:outer membrane protein assembly factor BamB
MGLVMSFLIRVAIGCGLSLGASGLAQAAASLALAPTLGPPTTSTKVTVSGFGAHTAVDVYFDTIDMCLVATNAQGSGSCTLKVPAAAQPQNHWISAVQRSSGSIVQAPFTVRTDWLHPHGDPLLHDGLNRYENTISTANAGMLSPVWFVKPSVSFTTTPVVVGGRVFICGMDGKLYAFNAVTGANIAGFPKSLGGAAQYTSAVAAKGIVYQVTSDNTLTSKLFAFNAATGAAVSKFPKTIGGVVYGAPVVDAGKIYVGASDGKIYGFNALDGTVLKNFPIIISGVPAIYTNLALFQGELYVGTQDGNLYIYNAKSGALLANLTTTGAFSTASAAVSGGALYFGSNFEHKLYAVDALSRAAIWNAPYTMAATVNGTPAIGSGQVFVEDTGGNLAAVDAATGNLTWNAQFQGVLQGSAVVANGVVYAGSTDALYALDAKTGAKLWQYVGENVTFGQNPVVVDGMVYVASSTNGLRAFSIKGASVASQLPGGDAGLKPGFAQLKPDASLAPQVEQSK